MHKDLSQDTSPPKLLQVRKKPESFFRHKLPALEASLDLLATNLPFQEVRYPPQSLLSGMTSAVLVQKGLS